MRVLYADMQIFVKFDQNCSLVAWKYLLEIKVLFVFLMLSHCVKSLFLFHYNKLLSLFNNS